MAVTKIWTIHEGSNIKQVLDYAANEGKTVLNIQVETDETYDLQERQQFQDVIDHTMTGYQDENDDMANVLDYAARSTKTEQKKYVSAINCSPERARDQMMLTKTHYHKQNGILLWHGYQSFKPGEVTPEEAHKIGMELAQNLWGEDYEILVCTHLDREHIHNHFVVNSVSFRTGKKLDVRWKDMARESDRLCKEYEKSVIENPQVKGKHYAEYQAEQEGRPTWTTAIKQDIDECILQSRNMQEFLKNLKSRGYTIKAGAKYFTLKPPGKERFVRIDRRLGEAYSLLGIENQIEENVKSGRYRMPEEKMARKIYTSRPRYTVTGYKALYIRYSYMLGVFPGKHMTAKQVNYLYREDLTRMHKIRKETQFICRNKIETLHDLTDVEFELQQDLKRYQDEKTYVVNRLRSASGADKDALGEKKTYLSEKIKDCRRKLYWCKDIKENSRNMQEKIEKVREMERGEHGLWTRRRKKAVRQTALHTTKKRIDAQRSMRCTAKKKTVHFIKVRKEGIEMEGTREAEMIVQFALQGMTYALRLSGTAAKNIAAMIAALAKQPDKSPGATRMKALLQSGEPLDYYTVPADKMQEFAQMSKKYGIQYCVAMNQDGAYDLVVKKSDSSRINRISEMLGIGQVQGSLDQDLTDAEKQTAENLTPEQKILQDMMSPNRDERERDEPNFNQELPEGERASVSSSININERESVVARIENYHHAQESARDMFAGARSLREAVMTDLPDGAEPVVANIGWDRPVTRYNEDGEQLFRGKTADQMTDLDKMQYMVDQEMLSNGKLSENFIQQMYVSGYRVDESGMVSKDDSSKNLTSKEKLMIADMMREPERANTEKALTDVVEAMKGVEKHEHRQ